MKNRQNPRTKSILILTFSLLLFRVAFGDAADNIQLRKYPSRDAIVLGTVSSDAEFKIIEKYGPWFYILVEGTTYGGGWVYANDLKPEPIRNRETSAPPELPAVSRAKTPETLKQGVPPEKPSSQIQRSIKIEENLAPPSHGKVSMSTVKIHSSTHPASPKKTPGAKIISNNIIPDKKKREKPSIQSENIAKKRDLQSVQPSIDPVLEGRENTREQTNIPPQTESDRFKDDLHIAGRKTAPGNAKETQTNPEQETISSRTKEHQIHEQVIATTFEEHSKADMFNTAAPGVAERESRNKKNPAYKGGFRALLDFGFKLLSVALSCLAIIFSYRAKKMATLSYQVAIQFQRDFEIRQERELDGRY